MTRSDWQLCVRLASVLFAIVCGPILYAQAQDLAAAAAGVPATAEHVGGEWGGGLMWGFLATSGMEWVKRHPSIAILSEKTKWWYQRGGGIVLAILAGMGVHWAFDPTLGRFTVDGLIPTSMWSLGTESARQWIINELTYRMAVKNYRPARTS